MSRIADMPITLPKGTEVKVDGQRLSAKGSNGEMHLDIHPLVTVEMNEGVINVKAVNESKAANAMSGTMRSLANNTILGVTAPFEKKLQLIGVGYRAKASGQTLEMNLGFSHPIIYELPEQVQAETPSATEVVLKSANKQVLGQVAAEIRAFRKPEPYKGKGVRYADEYVKRKEAKKSK